MIFGITLDRTNPAYTVSDIEFWMPQLKAYLDTDAGKTAFENLYPLANNKIFYSIFGTDWKYAMSLCIAHYLVLIAKQSQAPVGSDIGSIATTDTYTGILASMTVGSFSKSYDLAKTMIDTDDAKWWNMTSFGAMLMALYKTKAVPSIFVVTPTSNLPKSDIRYSTLHQTEDMEVMIAEVKAALENKQDKGDYAISVEKAG